MGGHQGGEVASRLAVETLQVAYRAATADALSEAIAVANHRIRNEGDADPDLRGMGTTVVALALMPEEPDPDEPPDDEADLPQHLLIANVGDSRAYLFRDGSLTQLTEDHSLVADLVREGRITAEEAEVHPQRNIVTRVLGVYETVEVDLWPVDPVRRRPLPALLRRALQRGRAPTRSQPCSAASPTRTRRPPSWCGWPTRAAGATTSPSSSSTWSTTAAWPKRPSAALAGEPLRPGRRAAAGARRCARRRRPGRVHHRHAHGRRSAIDGGLSDDELDSAAPPEPTSRKQRRRRRRARPADPAHLAGCSSSCCWSLGVIGGAVATIQWYGTSTYFVGFDDDEVVIYQGRPGGLLWIDPELVERTGIERADVPAALPRPTSGPATSSSSLAQGRAATSPTSSGTSTTGHDHRSPPRRPPRPRARPRTRAD